MKRHIWQQNDFPKIGKYNNPFAKSHNWYVVLNNFMKDCNQGDILYIPDYLENKATRLNRKYQHNIQFYSTAGVYAWGNGKGG